MYGGGPANSVLMLSLVKGNHRMMTQHICGVGEFPHINIRADVVLTILSQVASVLIGVSYSRAITCEVLSRLWTLCFKQVRQIFFRYTEDFPITSVCKVATRITRNEDRSRIVTLGTSPVTFTVYLVRSDRDGCSDPGTRRNTVFLCVMLAI